MTFRGNLLLYSLWYELHPFENLRRKGVNEHGPVQMSGGEREIFFGLMKRSGMAGKNLLRKALPSPGQQDGLCLSQPRRMDSNG